VQITARETSVVDTDVANAPPALTVTEVEYRVFRVSAEDPDNDPVICTAAQPFCGMVSELGDGLLRYTPTQGRSPVSSLASPSPPTTAMGASRPRSSP
jgi:hypothetical protein